MERSSRRSRLAVIGALIFLLLAAGTAIIYGLGYAVVSPARVGERTGPEVGLQAPDFELERTDGGSLRLSDLRGKPVLVNFWATWCAPCKLEMPNIQKYYEQYPDQFEVVAVNSGESLRIVTKFAKEMGISFPVVLDPSLKAQALYHPPGLPTTYIIDAEGIVRAQHIGLLSEKKLAEYLKKVGVSID